MNPDDTCAPSPSHQIRMHSETQRMPGAAAGSADLRIGTFKTLGVHMEWRRRVGGEAD